MVYSWFYAEKEASQGWLFPGFMPKRRPPREVYTLFYAEKEASQEGFSLFYARKRSPRRVSPLFYAKRWVLGGGEGGTLPYLRGG